MLPAIREGNPVAAKWTIIKVFPGTQEEADVFKLRYPEEPDFELGERRIVYNETPNLVTKAGRVLTANNLFAMGSSGIICSMAAGACATAATVNDTRLTFELIGNATRKRLTNTSGASLSSSDVTAGTTVISGYTFEESLTAQAAYETTDGNDGNYFGEFGLTTTLTLPVSGISTSGTLFNHLIIPGGTPILKQAGVQLLALVTLYF